MADTDGRAGCDHQGISPRLPYGTHVHAIVFSMSKTITLRVDEATYEEFREAAAAENRPLSNLIQTAALAKVRERQFVDDAEMPRSWRTSCCFAG